ncbi:hypothetical protein FSP39_012997, partial [Pinctada imbricata]
LLMLIVSKCNFLDAECPDGKFGWKCKFTCYCANTTEACGKSKGDCLSGCRSNRYGPGCQLLTAFKYDVRGHGYRGKESFTEDGTKCDSWNKEVYVKLYSLKPEQFPDNEIPGAVCRNPENSNLRFGEAKRGPWCFTDSSFLYKRSCDISQIDCSDGRFGTDCAMECHCANVTEVCNKKIGTCSVSGCHPGWIGTSCQETCTRGFYGRNCTEICGNCKNSACRHTDGVCMDGCYPGWTLRNCTLLALQTEDQSEGGAGGVIGAVVAVLVVIIIAVIIIFIVYRYTHIYLVFLTTRVSCKAVVVDTLEDTDPNDNLNEPIYANVNTKRQSEPIKIADLYDYIRSNKKNECEGFKKEFAELPIGLMALCETAKKPENRPKNRYGNITAYDHSRVVLEPLPNEPNSDYINANYMDNENIYYYMIHVSLTGPTKVMIRDFWRMVWQKRICKIVMLTNLMEACKKKCEQYWPEEGTQKYGDITVEILDTALFTDYTIRTFRIASAGSSRIVKQFHFTSWSDHGALTYPTPLLAFKRKVKMYSPDSKAPIVVHCSAGIGRSGTYIAIDYLLEQAKAEDLVDVLKYAQLMRTNRTNMIQTWEQYVFVYEALLEAIKAGETTIPNSGFRAKYEELCTKPADKSKTPLEEQFEVLQLITPTVESSQYKAAIDPENINKNRVKNVLPANRCRPYLYTQVDGCNDYINAVFLPGYTHRDSFIVTQMPLHNTVADFWRMMYDYNSHTVIMLNEFNRNDETCALYWPEEYGYTVEYDPLSIELLSSTEDNNVSVRIFKLSNHIKKEERAIKQFQLNSWPDSRKVPGTTNSLMQLIEMVYDWLKQNGKGPLTVHCMNGASKSGLFCAVNLLFERMQRDIEVDVYQTVKTIRINRPQFIEDVEQYQFIYQMALEYLDYTGR